MELIARLDFFVHDPEEDTSVWGSSPCSRCPFKNEDFLPLYRDGGSRILIIHHSPFDEIYVDEGELRETSAQCILITSAALKEFLQIIFSAK